MAKDVDAADATVALAAEFRVPRASRVIVSISWESLAGGGSPMYYLRQSNLDAATVGDEVPALPSGLALSGASGNATIEVNSPALNFIHVTDEGTLSAGTISIETTVLYNND